ncbi:MAG: amidase family protein [Elainellaceae cyanobacterium]
MGNSTWVRGAIATVSTSAMVLLTGVQTALAETFRLTDATITDINQAFESGALTSEQLVQLYLNRIAAYDQQGPAINSLITVNPNAIALAQALDQERQTDGARSILHGMPIILKDNYDTVDLPTSAGSITLKGSIPPDDAFVVQQLREAGAIILGKANMSEFALSYGRLGYSSLGGLTLNPYRLSRNASGSSSGTAAAIAANFAVFGTGTDTAGSIRGPASVTGLVGIKPTLGLTSRDGIVPLTLSFDVGGPMARTVTDAAIALGFMTGIDLSDPRTLESEGQFYTDYTQFLDANSLDGVRIGIARDFLGGNPEVDELTEQAIATLENLGATVVDVQFSETLQSGWSVMSPAVTAEFEPQLEHYLSTLARGFPKTLSDIIAISMSPEVVTSETPVNPGRISGFVESEESPGLADTGYLYAVSNEISAVRNQILSQMDVENLDAIIYPTMACPASPLFDTDDPTYVCNVGDPYTAGYLANIAGFPDVTLPMGYTSHGLPVGLSFMAEAYSEPKLLGFVYAFEQATQVRQSPDLLPALPGEEIEY